LTERRRRRSRDVALVALPVLAFAFSACGGDDETAYCVDENDQIVENTYCDEEATNEGAYPGAFFWYYGASGGSKLVKGSKLKGGTKVITTNIAENVKRGGFGSSSRTSASGIGRVSASSSGGG
jgi:hypothetical protein